MFDPSMNVVALSKVESAAASAPTPHATAAATAAKECPAIKE
jgi:hypothetical protein